MAISAKPSESTASIDVRAGDTIYYRGAAGPEHGRVLCAGKHGCTVESGGKRWKVRWKALLGHRERIMPAYEVADAGEDGMILREPSGKSVYLSGQEPAQAKQKTSQKPVRAEGFEWLTKGGAPGAPGLVQRPVVDKRGRVVRHWVRVVRPFDQRQLALNFEDVDPYPNIEVRPDTTEKQKQIGRAALHDLGRQIRRLRDRRGKTSLLGAGVWRSLSEGKPAQLIGATIRSAEDLAVAAQVYRDPRFETFRAIFIKNGRVVGETAISSRMPSAVQTGDKFFESLQKRSKEMEADGFWLLHNHPGGDPKPSQADHNVTQFIARLSGVNLFGHVVIDDGRYAILPLRDGDPPEIRKFPEASLAGTPDHMIEGREPAAPHPLLGAVIDGPAALAIAGKALQQEVKDAAVLVMTGSKGRIRLLTSVSLEAMKEARSRTLAKEKNSRLRAWIRGLGRAGGAGQHVFLVVNERDWADHQSSLWKMVSERILVDVVRTDGESLIRTMLARGVFLDWGIGSTNVFETEKPGVMSVAEPSGEDESTQDLIERSRRLIERSKRESAEMEMRALPAPRPVEPHPLLYRDNPGGRFEENLRKRFAESGRDRFGVPYFTGDVTAGFREKIWVPVEKLARAKGMRGEQRNVRKSSLDWLTDYMGRTGRLPPTDSGAEYVPFLQVFADGTAMVNEGNHRIMAAAALGWEAMPVEIRYYSGGENTTGAWAPERLLGYHDSVRGKEGGLRPAPELRKGDSMDAFILLFKGGPIAGRPGLALVPTVDKHGQRTARWRRILRVSDPEAMYLFSKEEITAPSSKKKRDARREKEEGEAPDLFGDLFSQLPEEKKDERRIEPKEDEDGSGREPADGLAVGGGDEGAPALADDPLQPYLQHGIRLSRAELTPIPETDIVPEDLARSLRLHGQHGAAAALKAFDQGFLSFLISDGTGAGKTRQALAVMETLRRKMPDQTLLIVTQNKRVIEDAFMTDAKTMGVRVLPAETKDDIIGPGIYVCAYNRLGDLKGVHFPVIALDEAHNLKNTTSAKTKHAREMIQRAQHTLLLTATPGDKPEHIGYLAHAFNFSYLKAMQALGYQKGTYGGMQLRPGVKREDALMRLGALYDDMTKKGLMCKREVSMDNLDLDVRKVRLSASEQSTMHAAFASMLDFVDEQEPLRRGLAKMLGLSKLRTILEPYKIDATIDAVKQDIAAGKQVVVFANRIHDADIPEWFPDKDVANSIGTLEELSRRLKDAGISVGRLYGKHLKGANQTIRDFQSGKVRALIATPQAGGTGVNLDDTTGDRPRSMVVMTAPFSSLEAIQMIGRINRLTTRSPATARFIQADGLAIEDWNFDIIKAKLRHLGATVQGDVAKLNLDRLEGLADEDIAALGAAPAPVQDGITIPLETLGLRAGPRYRAKEVTKEAAAPPVEKTYLRVPYEKKDLAKYHGARWDPERRQWYVRGAVPDALRVFHKQGEPDDGGGRKEIRTVVKPNITPEQMRAVETAVCRVAGMCDGAHTEDGVGFSKHDQWLRDVAYGVMAGAKLSPEDAVKVRRAVYKYKRQYGESLAGEMGNPGEGSEFAEGTRTVVHKGKTYAIGWQGRTRFGDRTKLVAPDGYEFWISTDKIGKSLGEEIDGVLLFAKAGPIANRAGLHLETLTDRAGHQTKRWKRSQQPQKKERPRKADEPEAQDKPAPAGDRPEVGSSVQFSAGGAKGQGKVVAAGKDGATVRSDDGKEYKVYWKEMKSSGPKKPDWEPRAEGENDKAYAKRVIDKGKAPDSLPEDHDRYFNTDKATHAHVPMDRLHSSKSDDENQQGGDNGRKRMEAAYHGALGRRDPITVMPHKDQEGHFEIVDGNGTYTSAKKMGWSGLPVKSVDREIGEIMMLAEKAKGVAEMAVPREKWAALGKKKSQPEKSPEALFERGKDAQVHLEEWLNKGNGIANQMGYRTMGKGPDQMQEGDWDGDDKMLFIAPMKKMERSLQKVESDYKGDWTQLVDVVRCTMAANTLEDLKEAIDTMEAKGMRVARTPKNKFVNPTPVGYMDLNFIVELPNGMLAEIQFNIKDMMKAKNLGHPHYEVQRELEAKYAKMGIYADDDPEKPDPARWDPDDAKVWQREHYAQQEIYFNAWADHLAKHYGEDVQKAFGAGRIIVWR
jgi:hypothetical protein